MPEQPEWHIQPTFDLPAWFVQQVHHAVPGVAGDYTAQLLWQRGIRDSKRLTGFLNPDAYTPTDPFAFGQEMYWAVDRLRQAWERGEPIAIWGDFDADGITATAVLWEGLGQFFKALTYRIPNRLTESHGLTQSGITELAAQGYRLLITCDTGSTDREEIQLAHQLGMDVIITDHHTLPIDRPPVIAILNPRYLPTDHPLAHLSGVAVAYKLVEALYQTLPEVPQRPLTDLLDLVAIGLIADLVQLTGDGRYLAQRGIEQLQKNQKRDDPPRPGVAKLLELCRKNGDRPTDISFGLGPRINAISRIHGDAHFCVQLLTDRNPAVCLPLAEATELANARRKALQRDVAQQVKARLAHLDLSTTSVIVLADPQWSVGILGLVANQIAQEYGRPTILLSLDESTETEAHLRFAKGSARSVQSIDLYQLVAQQAHWLHRYGGHPFAMGLSLPIANIPLFTEAINRQLREQPIEMKPIERADLTVTVADLGDALFKELKLLEPCGMGNPVPKLLIRNVWFQRIWHKKIQDSRGQKIEYIRTEFELRDDSCRYGFPGLWWGHYKDELPTTRCDVIVELDFNSYKDAKRDMRYEVRLVAVRPHAALSVFNASAVADWILDWRTEKPSEIPDHVLLMTTCPSRWEDLHSWFRQARRTHQSLALAYPPAIEEPPVEIWQQLVGIAKYLSRTGHAVSFQQLREKLGIGERPLQIGLKTLKRMGFEVQVLDEQVQCTWCPDAQRQPAHLTVEEVIEPFLATVQEEQFQRRYFYQVPLATIQAIATRF